MKEIKSVRIICDGTLKDKIVKKVLDLGATGYTYWECHGMGRKEMVPQHFSGFERVYIEVWCVDKVADKIVKYCDGDQFRSHGVTVGVEGMLISDHEMEKFQKKG